MAFNLSRNTTVFVSTVSSGFSPSNTFEVPVLNGYSFSQDSASENIGLDEAGEKPVRGQKVFNTALNPADVSFTTYIRPFMDTTNHSCVERILWEALCGAGPYDTNTVSDTTSFRADFENSDVHELMKLNIYFSLDNVAYKVTEVQLGTAEIDFSIAGISQIAWSGQGATVVKDNTPSSWTAGADYLAADTSASFIKNKLSTMVLTDNNGVVASGSQTVTYTSGLQGTAAHTLDGTNTYLGSITVDGGSAQNISVDSSAFAGTTVFDLVTEINDQIVGANVGFTDTGKLIVTSVSQGTGSTILIADDATNGIFGSGTNATGIASDFASLDAATAGSGTGTVYTIPITGGSLTVDNNITFLTPEELGKVNTPIGSFTGVRSISGSMTAYLRTGTTESGGLLDALLANLSTVTQDFNIVIAAGGAQNAVHAKFTLNHAHLTVPSTEVADVISTTIEFTGLGQDLEYADELLVEYKAS